MKMRVLGKAFLIGLLVVIVLAMLSLDQASVAESAPEAKGGDDLLAKVEMVCAKSDLQIARLYVAQLGQDMALFEELCAEHRLTVDYHGAHKPTGVSRTWPSYLTSEGVQGLEWSKGRPYPTNEHNVTLPYTRMLAGPMDYTPGAFDLDGAEGSPKQVQGTRAHQIAMLVVYFSPFQMLVDYPAAYEASPDQFPH